jgi:hypothetical protein
MVSFEEVFGDEKPEKRHDVVKELIGEMNKYSNEEDFEMAKYVLDKIKEYLELPEDYESLWTPSKLGDIQTLKDIDEILKANFIRLNPKHYSFSDWLDLLLSLDNRKSELQGIRTLDVTKKRKIVAEEMLCLGISIPRKRRGIGRMPNRAFLDVLYSVHPDLCKHELGRREQVKLWKAIEKGDKEELQKTRQEVSRYSSR